MDIKQIKELYNQLKTKREQYKPLWRDIAKYAGIRCNIDYDNNLANNTAADQKDQYIDDPTSAMSIEQSASYLNGIVCGNDNKIWEYVPTEDIIREAGGLEPVSPYYKFITKQIMRHLTNPESGFVTSAASYFYDDVAFGTAGVGLYKNPDFIQGRSQTAFIAKGYGIDNIAIDEGKNGLVEYIFINYNWCANQIVREFAFVDGELVPEKLNRLPNKVVQAYRAGRNYEQFKIIHGVFPREDYSPRFKGARGTKYRGVWFTEDNNEGIFAEEDYAEFPIGVCRPIRIRGEIYGRSSGTMVLSTIRTVDYVVGKLIEIIEKMGSPPMGIYNSSLFGDKVIDTSAEGLVVFNEAMQGNSSNPMFPLFDVKDPSGIINFIIPYLNEKISSAFKIDMLLDFNSKTQMTAAESSQRYIIRGQALAGILSQQYNEFIYPIAKVAASHGMSMGLLGISPETNEELAKKLAQNGLSDRIIPDAIWKAVQEGRQWYDVKANDRMTNLVNTQKLEALIQFMNVIGMVAQVNPQILMAVDFYKLVSEVAKEQNIDASVLIGERQYKDLLDAQAAAQEKMMQMQEVQVGAKAGKDVATAQATMRGTK